MAGRKLAELVVFTWLVFVLLIFITFIAFIFFVFFIFIAFAIVVSLGFIFIFDFADFKNFFRFGLELGFGLESRLRLGLTILFCPPLLLPVGVFNGPI